MEPFLPFLPPSSFPLLPPLLAPLGFESAGPSLGGIGEGVLFESPFPSDALASFFPSSSTARCSLSNERSFLREGPAWSAEGTFFPESEAFRRESGARSVLLSSRLVSCSSGSSFESSGGGFSRRRTELTEKAREVEGMELPRRAEVSADRKLALYRGEAMNGRRRRGRGVWWSAALQGRIWPRSMLLD